MSRIPGWAWVMLAAALLFAPDALGSLLGDLWSGVQTAWASAGW